MMTFGKWLNDWIFQRDMSQRDLAKAIGISQSSISSHISGKRRPSFRSVKRYCDFFGEFDVYGVYELVLMA